MAAASTSSSSTEEQLRLDEQPQRQPPIAKEKECIHKTKFVQFFGRSTPIVLQNDNGPCPLLAICNTLLLRNNLNLSPDTTEVSQEKLLSLVAERLIDSNSNVNDKDAGYIENQQQNIADAIDLLPCLATGIDVNIKFRRIDDFEFTRECAIFDLLDIPLYHGWIVDPQDYDTANAIGSKSYNSLMGELVALETQSLDKLQENNADEEDCVDFTAATTATLGVPSPCLTKTMSFDDPRHGVADYHSGKKGDLEEEAELSRILKLSEAEIPNAGTVLSDGHGRDVETPCAENSIRADTMDVVEEHTGLGTNSEETASSFTNTPLEDHLDPLHMRPTDTSAGKNMVTERNVATLVQVVDASAELNGIVGESTNGAFGHREKSENINTSPVSIVDAAEKLHGGETPPLSSMSGSNVDSDFSCGRLQQSDEAEPYTPSIDGSEPIYEGEECILDPSTPWFEDREPVYEGEAILAKQADRSTGDPQEMTSKIEITPHQGELIRKFLRNSASQLTINGLFCLQDGLKERELCVFFRNNHFSTMFKLEGELYLLATDQGYINQPDLVWEKLNEVNGDTLFMTGNFKEFKVDSPSNNNRWDEQNAVASTADFIASIDSSSQAGVDVNSDLQLAIALQQQEFEEQQQQQHHASQHTTANGSRLITGPQVATNNARPAPPLSSSKTDAKKSDKCSLM